MAQDVLHHGEGDERVVAAVGLSEQEGFGGGFGGQGERGERVHDQIDPKHLDRLQGRILQRRQSQVRNPARHTDCSVMKSLI